MDPFNTSPAAEAITVTPADATYIEPTRGLYVGVSGDVKVIMLDGTTVTFTGLAAGVIHPICCVLVFDTDTTATNIVALR
ncbi:MAG: hypothetical protein PVH18_04540 [Chloroflexota bacterium]|jgi:hypothetical protein